MLKEVIQPCGVGKASLVGYYHKWPLPGSRKTYTVWGGGALRALQGLSKWVSAAGCCRETDLRLDADGKFFASRRKIVEGGR